MPKAFTLCLIWATTMVLAFLMGTQGTLQRFVERKSSHSTRTTTASHTPTANTKNTKSGQRTAPALRTLAEWQTLLDRANDPNQRIYLLTRLLDQAVESEFPEIYSDLLFASEAERSILLNTWFTKDIDSALTFLQTNHPAGLEEALALGLLQDEKSTLAWSELNKVNSPIIIAALDDQSRTSFVEFTIDEVETLEESIPLPLADLGWVEKFALGQSVNGTAREVVILAASDGSRARDWLRLTGDRRAARKSARIVGSASAGMSADAFNNWLDTLDPDLADLAASGYLEELATMNPEDALSFVQENKEALNLDGSIFLILDILFWSESLEAGFIASFITEITDPDLAAYAKKQFEAPGSSEDLAASVDSAASVMQTVREQGFDLAHLAEFFSPDEIEAIQAREIFRYREP